MPKRVKKTVNNFYKKEKITVNLKQSYTSLILGAIVVLIIGLLVLAFGRVSNNPQTSSLSNLNLDSEDSNTSSTYTVRVGDNLWSISEQVFNDGYKWSEIAKLNNLANPNIIHVGNKLTLPAKESAGAILKQAKSVPVNNSITGGSYTVVKGDCLWTIAVRAYGDGFKWVEIARVNQLANPRLIHSGNYLILPR